MTQETKATWFTGACLLTPPVVFMLFELFGSKVITINGLPMPFALLGLLMFLFTLKLLFVIAGIAFVVQGFRVHWGWGLANLLVPLAFIVFIFIHPRASKIPLTIMSGGIFWIFIIILFNLIGPMKS